MNDYKIGCPAYLEYTNKGGYDIKGVFFLVSQDPYWIEIQEEEKMQLVSKRSIKIYEPERDKWPAWCLPC
jgi:hypothetical protein